MGHPKGRNAAIVHQMPHAAHQVQKKSPLGKLGVICITENSEIGESTDLDKLEVNPARTRRKTHIRPVLNNRN
jgi:hypothetical protein